MLRALTSSISPTRANLMGLLVRLGAPDPSLTGQGRLLAIGTAMVAINRNPYICHFHTHCPQGRLLNNGGRPSARMFSCPLPWVLGRIQKQCIVSGGATVEQCGLR